MPRLLALLTTALLAASSVVASERPLSTLHLESVAVELDREVLRPSGSRVGIGAHRAARLEAELALSLRAALEASFQAAGLSLAEKSAAAALVRVRASRVRLHPIADDLAAPLVSYGRSEAGAHLVLQVVSADGQPVLSLSEDYATPDPGELRPQSALHSRKALEDLFARFAREAGRRLGGRG